MKKAFKLAGKLLLALIVLGLLAGSASLYYFKQYLPSSVAPLSFPQVEGSITLQGLSDSVDIHRDDMGIPHIYASHLNDLFFAQGYTHAQDRFWQMDFQRHVGTGRLAEMFGEAQANTDTFLRTLGWQQTAEQEWQQLSEESKTILTAYSQGVNAYLNTHKGRAVSLEYAILDIINTRYTIEPWQPIHSLVWGKVMAWNLRSNMNQELERANLLQHLSPEQVDQLFPPYPSDHPTIVNQLVQSNTSKHNTVTPSMAAQSLSPQLLATTALNSQQLDTVLGAFSEGIGSNSWVVSGKHTASGKPLLANDPHLGIQMPSIWYQMGLHCKTKSQQCPYSSSGFSFAGVPGVIIGHNERIAWGYTNAAPDVMDLFIEKVNPDNPDQYEVNGQWVDFDKRNETIHISGKVPREITVRSSRHGPIISDSYGPLMNMSLADKAKQAFKQKTNSELPDNYVIALAWTANEPASIFEAIWGFNKANNWQEFRQAAKGFQVPAQNLIYADIDGNIGYQMPGKVPIRKQGDGSLPVPGWTGDYDWQGYIPFDELPSSFNPPEGYIATANNKIPPQNYPHFISGDWDYGFRAERIVHLITNAQQKIDIDIMKSMQADAYNANAATLVPHLLALADKFDSDISQQALALLKKWDYQSSADSAAAAVFETFWKQLLPMTVNDELPPRQAAGGGSRWYEVMRKIAPQNDHNWWDDKHTPDTLESRDDIIVKAFKQGLTELQSLQGNNAELWHWGALHHATFKNATLGQSGIFLFEDLFNRGPYPSGGSQSTVNATGWNINADYAINWLPSMRMVVDLDNLDNSVSVHTTGQSGHAYHPHYDDMATLWSQEQYYPMLWSDDKVIKASKHHLQLVP